jgi:hypothetical protein
MLDCYIIDRIKREKEIDRERDSLVPLKIHVPENPVDNPTSERPDERKRGISDIDYQL